LGVQAACIIQIGFTGFFMIANHPFQQVYFNSLVSHKPEFLRKNYEMDYWAVSFKQGLDHILETDKSPTIKINGNYYDPLRNNILMLDEDSRNRIKTVNEGQADYFFTNFRDHPNDYPPYKNEYSIKVLNSTIFCILKLEKDTAKLKQIREEAIANLNKSLAIKPDNFFEQTELGLLYSFTFNYDSAEMHLKQAFQLSPANIRSISNLASLYFTEKKYAEAIGNYKKVLELDQDHVSSYSDIAACYGSMGKNDSVIYYAKKAVSIDSNFKMSYQILAATYSVMNIPDSARKYGSIADKK
jgi:tetratricopeptide (TPR) repeat protein